MSKHATTPWRAVDGRYTAVGIAHMTDGVYNKPYQVAAIVADDPMSNKGWRYVAVINGKSTGEVDDDARLIAAAPELLDTLRELTAAMLASGLVAHFDGDERLGSAYDAARAVLAKVQQ